MSLQVTHFSDPGCPWAWSASPAFAALRWRYGDQLEWRHVMIGLTENGAVYERRGYTPGSQAAGYRKFRVGRGMPFATEPRERIHGTWPMCRVVVATRRLAPEREFAVFRALQFAQFTEHGVPRGRRRAARRDRLGAGHRRRRDRRRRGRARRPSGCSRPTATRPARPPGSPTEFQGKSANTDGRVRFTAPSVRFSNGETTLEAGGFQSFEAYEVLIANLDTSLERRAPAEDAAEVLPEFPDGLTTAEVAQIMAEDKYPADLVAAEDALIAATAAGQARRVPFGHDALWVPADAAAARLAAAA